jgi:hypothetical protein
MIELELTMSCSVVLNDLRIEIVRVAGFGRERKGEVEGIAGECRWSQGDTGERWMPEIYIRVPLDFAGQPVLGLASPAPSWGREMRVRAIDCQQCLALD